MFFGNFIAFQVESIRTQANIVAIAMSELNSPKPGVKMIGMRRLAGWMGINTLRYGVVTWFAQKVGMGMAGLMGYLFDDEEETQMKKDYRMFSYFWQENSHLIPMKSDKPGHIRYMDATSSDPYGAWIKPMNAYFMAEDDEGLADLAEEFFGPYFDQTIWLDIYNAIRENKNNYGDPIYGVSDSKMEKVMAVLEFVARAGGPGTYNSYLKLKDAEPHNFLNELMGQLTGFKFYEVNFMDGFQWNYLNKMLSSSGRDSYYADARDKAYHVYQERGYEAAVDEYKRRIMPGLEQVREAYQAALRLGADERELHQILVSGTAKKPSSLRFHLRAYIERGEWMNPPRSLWE